MGARCMVDCWNLGHAVGQLGMHPYMDHIILYSSSYLLRRLIYKYYTMIRP